ncbi:uncharacterized protein LOC114518802 [Dendronephthya gigantea]|uniref:uncharacterized protein LOC114518802 n=1 Tax=Dendronephthya gigantea TaxID=151771 RepID=UPI00106D9775|nr:uncharacterized protein LOC114518802 [Dendronephthya gigantea]
MDDYTRLENHSDSETNETESCETGGIQALLYCKTSKGRAVGSPVVISLPDSEKLLDWKQCIRETIAETEMYPYDEVILNKLYFVNKNSRSLSLIAITGESGIQQVMLEYPPRQKNGRLSTSRIKLACDWHQKGHATPLRSSPRFHAAAPSKSPNSCSSNIPVAKEINCTYNIYVTAGVKKCSSVAEGPVNVIHNVPQHEGLKYVKRRLREEISDVCIKAGLYWLPKRGKQCHTLNSESDFQTAKDVYINSHSGNVENMRLAVVTLADANRPKPAKQGVKRSILPGGLQTSKHKKVVSSECSDDDLDDIADEEAYMNFLANGPEDKLKDTNDRWNKVHVELRKTLEKAGTLDRYGIPHLSLWTDLIIDGRVSGVSEEPDWSKHLDIVQVQPVPKRLSGIERAKGPSDVLAAIMMQHEFHREEERRKEQLQREKEENRRQMEEKARFEERKAEREHQKMMQSMLMSVLTSNAQSPTFTRTENSVSNMFKSCTPNGMSVQVESKDELSKENIGLAGLLQLTVEQVSDMFCQMNMDQYKQCIQDNEIDGAVLAFLSDEGLNAIGINNALHRAKILAMVSKKKMNI